MQWITPLDSFLMLARAGHGPLADRTTVSLDQLVTDAIATRRAEIGAQQIELRTALVPVSVAGSDTLLARMVDNVIEDSVRHNQRHGFIDVVCDAQRGTARLIVQSGGALLDEQCVAELARPFRRLGAERTGSENGHGLGLSIVAAVVDAHGGALGLRARPQGGLRGDTLCHMITQSQDPAMILMLTAAGSPVERVGGLALGADNYLPKPFHFPELVLRIRALARRKPAG